jgi:hypothetical protein
VVFVRALKAPARLPPGTAARIEISPDGMHWVVEGTTIPLPAREDETTFARVAHFGGWLRLAADLPEGATITVLASIHLKG